MNKGALTDLTKESLLRSNQRKLSLKQHLSVYMIILQHAWQYYTTLVTKSYLRYTIQYYFSKVICYSLMATPHRYITPTALYVCVDIPPQNLPLHTVNRTAILNTSLILDIWLKCTTVDNSFTWPSFGNFSHQSACLDLLLSPRFPHQTVLPFHTCSSVIHVQWKCAWVSCLTVPCRIVFAIISCWHIFIDILNLTGWVDISESWRECGITDRLTLLSAEPSILMH